MNDFQKQVLIGCCLGDISIQKTSKTTSRFQITHSIKQGDYLKHKYEVFKDLCNTPYKQKDRKYPVLYFNSISTKEIKSITDKFYCGEIRGVPHNIKKLISPISLAYWFMDDGTCIYNSITPRMKTRNSTIILCTDRYLDIEVELLVEMLKDIFNINSKIKNSPSMGDRYRIYIGTKDTQKFLNIIEPFIVPSMRYKIKRPYNLN